MGGDEPEARERRWNAAVLQQYLKRRHQAGISTHPGDLLEAARDMRQDLVGQGNGTVLLQQAIMDLLVMGLIVVTPHPRGGSEWRPVDVPTPYGGGALHATAESWS
jgi:hypothetical protein